jgi:hypothetical protein
MPLFLDPVVALSTGVWKLQGLQHKGAKLYAHGLYRRSSQGRSLPPKSVVVSPGFSLTAFVLVLIPAQRLPKTDFRCPYIRFGGSADINAVHQWWLWQLRDPSSAEDPGVFERGRSIRLVPLLLLLKNN